MNFIKPALVLLSFSAFHPAFTQERTLYFSQGKPSTADSASKVRKGVYENGKWHVYEFNKAASWL